MVSSLLALFFRVLYTQSGDSSDQATAGTSSGASVVAENAKSFIAGGFGGICAVLVGA